MALITQHAVTTVLSSQSAVEVNVVGNDGGTRC